jgi:polyferredoxin
MANETGRFQRWQKIAVDQLSYALNLIFTLSIAALGYCFSLLRDGAFKPGVSAKCTMLLAIASLAASAFCGLACIINRLWDFRGTAQRARGREDAPTQDELRGLGRRTWVLFYCHCAMFSLGVVALAIALLLTYSGKLS